MAAKPRKPLSAKRDRPHKRAATKPKRKVRQRRVARGPIAFLLALIGGILRFVWRILWGFGWRIALIFGLIIGGAVVYMSTTLPDYTALIDGRHRGAVTLLDRNGTPFAWRGAQFGGMVSAANVSPHLRNAVIATEDKRFYWHPGIDPIGIASAVRINLREGRGPLSGHGGSTLTQQTAKLLCLGVQYDPTAWENEAAYEADCRRTTLWRKAKEAIYAMAMELKYSKDEILTIYLNRAYLGSYGFEAGAQRYFDKHAAEVSAAEAAMLAGMLKAPTTLAPTRNLARSQARAGVVIGLMEDQGYLTAGQAAEARANPARLSGAARRKAGGYFADWVMGEGPDFFTRNTTEDVEIRTTLDPAIQKAAEDALLYVFEEKVKEGSKAEAAIVVMGADGAVRGMVGGRNVTASGAFNRATQALRQTGSSFKPFVYATALEMGFNPFDEVIDEPFCMNVPGSGQYCPRNYSKDFKGPVTMTEALRDSLNIPAVKISEAVGRDLVRQVAEQFGIRSEINPGPALALGSSESTLIEMTGAYAGILNGGSAVTPYGLVSLTLSGQAEPLMTASGGIRERVIREAAAGQLVWMMRQVIESGTGRRARIEGVDIAGKTGTSQEARDAWFIGFTADYVIGVWMGNDDNKPLSGVTGGGLPAEIWRETMQRILQGQVPPPLPARAPHRQVQPAPPPAESDGLVQDLLRSILGN